MIGGRKIVWDAFAFFVIFLILGRVGVPYIFLGHKDTNTLLS
jgi:hypothetical protein